MSGKVPDEARKVNSHIRKGDHLIYCPSHDIFEGKGGIINSDTRITDVNLELPRQSGIALV